MTKEDLIRLLKSDETWDEMEFSLNKFFSQNVCIPKSTNRHPYADVMHAYAEGATVQYYSSTEGWKDIQCPSFTLEDNYRIKPSEPVYEWLYYSRIGNTIWSTKEDAPTNMWCAEETKRLRS